MIVGNGSKIGCACADTSVRRIRAVAAALVAHRCLSADQIARIIEA
jgi:hypothetical protein